MFCIVSDKHHPYEKSSDNTLATDWQQTDNTLTIDWLHKCLSDNTLTLNWYDTGRNF